MVLSHIRRMVILSTCIFHIWLLRTCTVGRRSPAAILRYHGNKSWTLTFSAILLGDIHVSMHILAVICPETNSLPFTSCSLQRDILPQNFSTQGRPLSA